jgi:hypothetical protein
MREIATSMKIGFSYHFQQRSMAKNFEKNVSLVERRDYKSANRI